MPGPGKEMMRDIDILANGTGLIPFVGQILSRCLTEIPRQIGVTSEATVHVRFSRTRLPHTGEPVRSHPKESLGQTERQASKRPGETEPGKVACEPR